MSLGNKSGSGRIPWNTTELCGMLPFNNNPFPDPTLYGYSEILWAIFTFCWIYLIYSVVQKRKELAKMKLVRKKVRHK